ncbi:ATP-binding protein [Mesorhizobium sp. M0239]|uniref:ATP-binding protein n=1 Tax=Mesorhizobium sp. M0239 TaxID=2956924 RepID=UPI0033397AAB
MPRESPGATSGASPCRASPPSSPSWPFVRELDGFDFEAQPLVDQDQIRELATCHSIAHFDTVLFLGPPEHARLHLP